MQHEARQTTSDILIVEDNQVNALILTSMLRKHGHAPKVAWNGLEGVRMTTELCPRLVLMDLHMPGLDGYTAAGEIRRRMNGSSPTLVAVTADLGETVRLACREAGFAGVLAKPILIDELLTTVRRHLA